MLYQVEEVLLIGAGGKTEPHIHQITQAAFRVALNRIQFLPHDGLNKGAGDGIDRAWRHRGSFFLKKRFLMKL